MEKQEAVQRLSELHTTINDSIKEVETLCDQHGLEFSIGPARGMGGTYYGVCHPMLKGEWAPEPGWNPSSMSC